MQNSQESPRALAKRYAINQKTVVKWKQRETVADLPTRPKEAKSIVLPSRKRRLSLLSGCLTLGYWLTTAGIFENQIGAQHSLPRKNLGPLMSLMSH
jgi:hypothetical protein